MYTDPNLFGKTSLNTDKVGKTYGGMSQDQYYSREGSAAGMISNRLDEDDTRLNSISSSVAF
jgi:hypothetical protein